jgi:hypothetical protein
MPATRAHEIETGDRVPAGRLETVGGATVDPHLTRHASSVLVFPHPGCAACARYLQELDGAAGELDPWDGRAFAVPDEAGREDLARELSMPVVTRGGRLRALAGIPGDGAHVLVADRFGLVYRSEAVGPAHELPPLDDLVAEARYIAIQCPECGVPDHPSRGEEAWAF